MSARLGPSGLEVFAVEDDAVQVTWRRSPRGPVGLRATAGSVEVGVEVDGDGGPGGVAIGGLPADERVTVVVSPGGRSLSTHTLAPPPGRLLFRFATVNDLHIGATAFGLSGRMVERPAPPPANAHPIRCARAAVRDALAWGAQLLVVKGDLTDTSSPDHWHQVGELLAGLPVPVEVVPGNHDVSATGTVPAGPELSRHGLHLVHGVQVLDLPGVRLVLVDTTLPGHDRGRIAHVQDEVVGVVGRAPGPAVVALHHHPQRFRVPTFLPPGIPGPEASAFLDAIEAANPATLVTSGHTHRHRRRGHGALTLTEVGSTKDFPGAWAGYAVYEGGVRQVVRRVTAADCISWTEYTRRAVWGAWGIWAPGTLGDRCFSVTWPSATRSDWRTRTTSAGRRPDRPAAG